MQRLSSIPVLLRAAAMIAPLLLGTSFSSGQVLDFTTLVEFTGTSGAKPGNSPSASLFQASDNNFYGTTVLGGTANVGTLFKVTPAGAFSLLKSFTANVGPAAGYYPYGGLAQATDGTLFGTSGGDGTNSKGIIFNLPTSGATFTNLIFFGGTTGTYRGGGPHAALYLHSNGYFYGTTEYGGNSDFGTLFKYKPQTPVTALEFTTLIHFTGNGATNKGRHPNARLVDGGNGFLYGSTYGSPQNSIYGTLFKLKISDGTLTTLVEFTGESSPYPGKYPQDAMLKASDGNLYGTTGNGGLTFNAGVVYRVIPSTGTDTVTTIAQFSNQFGNAAGAGPFGGLVEGTPGVLYGTTQFHYGNQQGQVFGNGTIYRLTTAGVLTPKLIEFTGATGNYKGKYPYGGLIKGIDGKIYGSTIAGGASDAGTIFKLDVSAAPPLPAVVTGAASAIAGTSVTLNGTVHPQAVPTTYQFEYGTTASYGSVIPLTPGNTSGGNAVESASANVTGLTPGTLYHFHLKATNAGGTATGNDAIFTTTGGSQSAPTVVTGGATVITNTSATLSGTVDPNGAASSWQFEYGPDTDYGYFFPTTPGITGSGSSAESVSTGVTGLSQGVTIHYRLRATNSAGPADPGDDATFTTTGSPLPPSVATIAASNITDSSATLNSTVNPRGSETSWQFEYGPTPVLGSSSVIPAVPSTINALGDQSVSITLNGLTAGSMVYFRIKATSAVSVTPVYASTRSFTTLPPPEVITQPALGITTTSATLVGTLNARGRMTSWQFEYGPTSSYGSLAPIPAGNSSDNSQELVTSSLTDLPPGSTWHYHLTATTDAGANYYGEDLTFTTPQPPSVTTGSTVNLTATGATIQGTVNPHGSPTTWQFDYGTTSAYGTSLPVPAGDAGNGSAPQNVSAALTGLLPNTLYYYQLRATSTCGTSTTTDATFTTPNNIQGWRFQHFGTLNNTGSAANTADPDGDGIINQLEYGFGMNPNLRDAHLLPRPSYNGSVLIASFAVPSVLADVTYVAEVSTDLNFWAQIADSTSGTVHTFSAPVSSVGRSWMRLKVILQP